MAGWTSLGAGAKTLVLGGVAASAAVVTAVVWQAGSPPAPEPAATEAAAPAVEPAHAPAGESVAEAVPDPEPPATAEAVATAPQPPSFDVVRVEPDGATLVAGRAEAGQEVAVLVDGAEAAVTQSNPQGRFVVFLTLAASNAPRVMTLELRRAAGQAVPSTDQVLLTPSGVAEAAPAPEAPAATEVAEAPVAEVTVAGTPVPQTPAEAPDGVAAERALDEADPAEAPPAGPEPAVADLTAPARAGETAAPATAPEPAAGTERLAAEEPLPEAAPAPDPVADATAAIVPAAEPEPAPAPELPPAPVAMAQPAPAEPGVSEAGPAAALAAAQPAPEPARPEPAAEPAGPTAILLSGNAARVLQSAGDEAVVPAGTVSIDTIAYTAGGEVALSGRGAAQAFVRLYLDNRALLETAVAEDGTWGGTLPAVAPGVYMLRADQVSAAGQVTSRFETPFQREDPVALATPEPAPAASVAGARAAAAPAPGRVSITVQPGFTLWQIARDNYGDGTLYVRVYDANKTLIRDPDLIYPGQVFSVPQAD